MNNKLILSHQKEIEIKQIIKKSNTQFINQKNLIKNSAIKIRAGIAGGLPFDTLTSDVVSGCLPAGSACYGMCFAAKHSWEQGVDFAGKVDNIFDETLFAADLAKLPREQKYVRCGWNSDPSWNWETATKMAELARQKNLLMIFITKAFTKVSEKCLMRLVDAKAEMRVSISALDTNNQLEQRLNFIEHYRRLGGIVIPVLLTTIFKDIALMDRQNNIVDWLIEKDLPAAENSLRIPGYSYVANIIDKNKTRYIKNEKDFWSGRLYPDRLLLPTATSVSNDYQGIHTCYLSQLNKKFIKNLFFDAVKTHQEVIKTTELFRSPRMCGVSAKVKADNMIPAEVLPD